MSPAFLYIFYNLSLGTPLAVQWLRLHASNAGSVGLIPGQGIKMPHAAGAKNKKQNKTW